jgi:hypothetical protein
MDLMSFLFGQDEKTKRKTNYTPEQNQFFKQFLSQLSGLQGQGGQGGGIQDAYGLLQKYMDPNSQAYQDFEQPYLNEFNEKTLPGIAEQFAGANAMGGGLSSSGFGQALGGAASQYKSNLTGMKQGLQQQNLMNFINSYLQQSQMAMGAQPFMYAHHQGSQGLIPSMLTGFAQGAGKGLSGG